MKSGNCLLLHAIFHMWLSFKCSTFPSGLSRANKPLLQQGLSHYMKKSRLNSRTAKTDLTLAEEHLSRWEYRCSRKCVFNDLCHMCSYTDWYTSTAISRWTLGLMRRKMHAYIYWALNFCVTLITTWSSSWILSGLSIRLKNTSGLKYKTTIWNVVRSV